jgi:hypothetical protein
MKYLNLKLNLNQLTGLYLKMGFELRVKNKHKYILKAKLITYIEVLLKIKIKNYEKLFK